MTPYSLRGKLISRPTVLDRVEALDASRHLLTLDWGRRGIGSKFYFGACFSLTSVTFLRVILQGRGCLTQCALFFEDLVVRLAGGEALADACVRYVIAIGVFFGAGFEERNYTHLIFVLFQGSPRLKRFIASGAALRLQVWRV